MCLNAVAFFAGSYCLGSLCILYICIFLSVGKAIIIFVDGCKWRVYIVFFVSSAQSFYFFHVLEHLFLNYIIVVPGF